MRKGWGCIAVGLVLLANLPALRADTYSFSLVPPSGNIAGPPGATVVWGYSLDNESASDWLVTSDLQAGTFLDGSPNSVFDFPDLGPGQSVTVPFDPVAGTGLYEFTWEGSAPIGFTNTGAFELDAQWWSGDPLNGGIYVADAPATNINYSAVVTSAVVTSPVPEPSSWILIVIVLGMLSLVRRSGSSDSAPEASESDFTG
jgi:hypothetical protein